MNSAHRPRVSRSPGSQAGLVATPRASRARRWTRWILGTLLCLLLLAAVTHPATAQTYYFQVEKMDLEAFVQPDASVRLEYEIVFRNAVQASAIDVVDIGLPHDDYVLSSMSASVNDQPVTSIRRSTYVDIGVEVLLGAHAIQPGTTGTFKFRCTMPNMVYADLTNEELAALQLKPTWFDPSLQSGATQLRIGIHLPPGIAANEVRWHDDDVRYDNLGLAGEGDEAHLVAFWQFPAHRLSSANPKVGVSFPRRVMQRVVKISRWQLLVNWFAASPGARFVWGFFLIAIFLFTYYRFSNGTGCVLGALGVAFLIFLFVISPALQLLLTLPIFALCGLNEYALRRRRSKYLPAMATVEGGGIKRGLTAPQAAVVLELPLGQILTLVLFGLLKKNVIRIVSESPLRMEVAEPYRVTREGRLKAAERDGIALHEYEHPFLDRLLVNKPIDELQFSEQLGQLIRTTASRMKGFDLSDTRDYYRRIVNRAWQEADSIQEVAQRTQTVDRHFEWMMMDPQWGRRFTTWHERGYDYHPRWSRPGTSWTGGGTSSSAPAGRGGGSPSTTSLSEVAASFVGWAENTSGRLASTIEPGKMGLSAPQGLMNLSAVDKVTGDVLEALAKSSSSGGGGRGGGGGCACACAGCACACACAGGGR